MFACLLRGYLAKKKLCLHLSTFRSIVIVHCKKLLFVDITITVMLIRKNMRCFAQFDTICTI